jgi:hypothetical protein
MSGSPEHLVNLQEDIDLGIGRVVDLGFGDVAAHSSSAAAASPHLPVQDAILLLQHQDGLAPFSRQTTRSAFRPEGRRGDI